MKISADTKKRIENIKAESYDVKQRLSLLVARLEEHSGTKRIARKLSQVVQKLEDWQKAA